MNVKIVATKSCIHSLSLQHELGDLKIPFEVLFVEEHPDLIVTYNIRHSPNLLVNDEVVFRGQPSVHELREFFSARTYLSVDQGGGDATQGATQNA